MSDEAPSEQTGKQRSLQNLVAGRWQPGQSGNPGGRPKRKPLTDAINKILETMGPEIYAAALAARASQGDIAAFKEMADRVEGKVSQPLGGADDLPDLKIQAITRTIIEPVLVEDAAIIDTHALPNKSDDKNS